MAPPKITYEVRFVCYQYNCGGNMRNGLIACKRSFDSPEPAFKFAKTVTRIARITATSKAISSSKFASDYVADGYVEKFTGIFKITEEEVIQ